MSRPQAEVIAKYVIIDMFAKACSGSSTKDVINTYFPRAAHRDPQHPWHRVHARCRNRRRACQESFA